MLKFMRENAGSWLIKIILGLIVVVFIFFGMGSMGAKKRNQVAMVNDRPITMKDYKQSYQNIIEQMRQRFGNNLNDELLKMLQVEKQALDRLIEDQLISEEAEKLDIQITDKELQSLLAGISAFQRDGSFDIDSYRMVLSRNRLTPEGFEAMQRRSMRQNMVKEMVLGTVKVSDVEARTWYTHENTQMAVDYVAFEPASFDAVPDDARLKAYYDENFEKYKSQPQLKVQYLNFEIADYKEKVEISPEKIFLYYEENPGEFSTPEQVEASHILIKVDQDAGADAVEKARLDAMAVYEKAVAGEDFAELAKKYSEGPSKDNGGYLGKFEKDKMVKPFGEKAFAMKPGDISEPVKTRFGWHVIYVKAHNEASKKSLEEVSGEIKDKLTSAEMKNLAFDAAGKAFDAIVDGDDLEQAGLITGKEVLEAGPFTMKGPDGEFKDRAMFAQTAFELDAGEISDIKEIGDAYIIMKPVERIEPAVLAYEDVKDRVKTELKAKLQNDKAREAAAAFLESVKKAESFKSAAEEKGLTLKDTALFSKNSNIPEIGRSPEFTSAAFKLSDKNRLYSEVIKAGSNYYVISFKEKKIPDEAEIKKNIDDVKKRLIQTKQGRTYAAWLQAMKDKSDIQIQEGILN